jgi:hypothetical protein
MAHRAIAFPFTTFISKGVRILLPWLESLLLTFLALEEQVVSYVSHKNNIATSACMWTVAHVQLGLRKSTLYALKEKMQMEMDYYFDN